jgi:hypothetical protein
VCQIKYTVLVTVYQRIRAGFKQMHRYYTFKTRDCEQVAAAGFHTAKDRWRCPACLQLFTEVSLDLHHCLGGAPGYPRLNNLPKREDKQKSSRVNTSIEGC